MNDPILQQVKKRRLALGLKQKDMMLRIGISRQQYQQLESKGNPRLETLELIAKGLNSELMLIPRERLTVVQAALEGEIDQSSSKQAQGKQKKSISDDPWADLLGDEP
ncbi:MAG: helix-turn-helix transcriptional regulator [Gammaproteobacteria bacterium]